MITIIDKFKLGVQSSLDINYKAKQGSSNLVKLYYFGNEYKNGFKNFVLNYDSIDYNVFEKYNSIEFYLPDAAVLEPGEKTLLIEYTNGLIQHSLTITIDVLSSIYSDNEINDINLEYQEEFVILEKAISLVGSTDEYYKHKRLDWTNQEGTLNITRDMFIQNYFIAIVLVDGDLTINLPDVESSLLSTQLFIYVESNLGNYKAIVNTNGTDEFGPGQTSYYLTENKGGTWLYPHAYAARPHFDLNINSFVEYIGIDCFEDATTSQNSLTFEQIPTQGNCEDSVNIRFEKFGNNGLVYTGISKIKVLLSYSAVILSDENGKNDIIGKCFYNGVEYDAKAASRLSLIGELTHFNGSTVLNLSSGDTMEIRTKCDNGRAYIITDFNLIVRKI